MKNVAIVEDDDAAAALLQTFLERAAGTVNDKFNISRYPDAIAFLTGYKAQFDIVFMDIDMPDLNGLDAAKKLRESDKSVALIFVTNMAQFAVRGYEADALDFIVKPVAYRDFALKLARALEHLRLREDAKIVVPTADGIRVINTSSLVYAEVMNHHTTFHLTDGGELEIYGNLNKVEAMLPPEGFCRCSNCYLVNLRYVTGVKNYTVSIGGGGRTSD